LTGGFGFGGVELGGVSREGMGYGF
jgi:hypothetical protein